MRQESQIPRRQTSIERKTGLRHDANTTLGAMTVDVLRQENEKRRVAMLPVSKRTDRD
jgi:hypothetical protein